MNINALVNFFQPEISIHKFRRCSPKIEDQFPFRHPDKTQVRAHNNPHRSAAPCYC